MLQVFKDHRRCLKLSKLGINSDVSNCQQGADKEPGIDRCLEMARFIADLVVSPFDNYAVPDSLSAIGGFNAIRGTIHAVKLTGWLFCFIIEVQLSLAFRNYMRCTDL